MSSLIPENFFSRRDDFFAPFEQKFNQLFNDVFNNWDLSDSKKFNYPKIDIYLDEENNKLRIDACVPGVKAEDLDIYMQQNSLWIKGKMEQSLSSDKHHPQYIKEIRRSAFSREVALPEWVKETPIVSLDNGVLSLSWDMPKQADNKTDIKRIKVNPTEFEQLAELLEKNEWPKAAEEELICNTQSESEKNERANMLLELMIGSNSLKHSRFLDFGCGEGHTALAANEQSAALSVGYDIKKPETPTLRWEEDKETYLLTTNWEKAKERGPYDAILIYDVLDHTQDPEDVLKKVRSVLSNKGRVYLRCHPWYSRHGGHLYREKNKAFMQLIFQRHEIEDLLNKSFNKFETNTQLYQTDMMNKYEEWIKAANLHIKHKNVDTTDVEDFFKFNEITKKRIFGHFGNLFPKFLNQCYIEYILTK